MRRSPPRNGVSMGGSTDETRRRELGRLIPVWPALVADLSVAGRQAMIGVLRRALRAERQRGLSGHWSYDLARHAQLLDALRAEESALRALEQSVRETRPDGD